MTEYNIEGQLRAGLRPLTNASLVAIEAAEDIAHNARQAVLVYLLRDYNSRQHGDKRGRYQEQFREAEQKAQRLLEERRKKKEELSQEMGKIRTEMDEVAKKEGLSTVAYLKKHQQEIKNYSDAVKRARKPEEVAGFPQEITTAYKYYEIDASLKQTTSQIQRDIKKVKEAREGLKHAEKMFFDPFFGSMAGFKLLESLMPSISFSLPATVATMLKHYDAKDTSELDSMEKGRTEKETELVKSAAITFFLLAYAETIRPETTEHARRELKERGYVVHDMASPIEPIMKRLEASGFPRETVLSKGGEIWEHELDVSKRRKQTELMAAQQGPAAGDMDPYA